MPVLPTDAAGVNIELTIAILEFCITRLTSAADEVDGVADALNRDACRLILGSNVVDDTERLSDQRISRMFDNKLAQGANGMFPPQLVTMCSRLRSSDKRGQGAELQDATSRINDAIDEFQLILNQLKALPTARPRPPVPGPRRKRPRDDHD